MSESATARRTPKTRRFPSGASLLAALRWRKVNRKSFRVPVLVPIRRPRTERSGVRAAGNEWDAYREGVVEGAKQTTVGLTKADVSRFRERLRGLREAFDEGGLLRRDESLSDLVTLGQELLRRRFFALLLNAGIPAALTSDAACVVDVGAAAIRMLGRAPSGPRLPYLRFNVEGRAADRLGVEILSSGAFVDERDEVVARMRGSGEIGRAGFDAVLDGALDSPRSRVLARLLREGVSVEPLGFPPLNRAMLDLELMRLGQATTPGTTTMLLDSFYRGALFVDHSTNVSEQVQVIYAEEEWEPAFEVKRRSGLEGQARRAARQVLEKHFRFADASPIGVDHPRTARIAFDSRLSSGDLARFFGALRAELSPSGVGRRLGPGHRLLPVLLLPGPKRRSVAVREAVKGVAAAGFKELAVATEWVRHCPGLLQYFDSAKETNRAIGFGKKRNVILEDGRTIDCDATANKSIEAAAGAIHSGQGCIKIGLLGLTYEQMQDFVARLAKGLDVRARRESNQQVVYIGIIDEPLVTANGVVTDPFEISKRFIELRKRRAGALLLDTMHKGAKDERLVDGNPGSPWHLTVTELRELVSLARSQNCDLWVAGSFTEEQVYATAKDSPEVRPSLICLGGAERSLGGLRLEPRDGFLSTEHTAEAARQRALVDYHADIKLVLSRDNKLARDAGHVVGELERRGEAAAAQRLEAGRAAYLKSREACFSALAQGAKKEGRFARNVDDLLNEATAARSRAPVLRLFLEQREAYVDAVASHLHGLLAKALAPTVRGTVSGSGRRRR